VPDPGGFDGQDERKRELLPVITLHALDGEREGAPKLGQKRQA